ncbi:penicillin acylase family protein [Streptomyces thinghirensis]|nr:penicillin acylase family protein [Streptomyces thinghirensis]
MPTAVGVNGNGIGSNSWVVSGEHTITGKPLLANDPHLRRRCRPSGTRWSLHCRSVSRVPVRRRRLHLRRACPAWSSAARTSPGS